MKDMNEMKDVNDMSDMKGPIDEHALTKFLQAKCLIPGGLGLWEMYFRKICQAWGRIDDRIRPQHIIFAADNGCNMEGYVGYNYEVTQKQSRNMVLGNTAATHFCTFNQIPYEVVDVGIASDDGIGVDCKVAKGTKNILHEPAMTDDEYIKAFNAGTSRVKTYVEQGINLFSFGEMGLGNTTTSACVLSALVGARPEETVGPGSWPDKPDLMKRKLDFVHAVLDQHRHALGSSPLVYEDALGGTESGFTHLDGIRPIDSKVDENLANVQILGSESERRRVERIISHVGGFDIAAITGAMLACVEYKVPFVIDGFITAVAAACATHMNLAVKEYALPSHHSRERGMDLALREVGLSHTMVPIQAQMAMGEGTGAILMVQILKTTQYMFVNVGTFADMMKL